MMQQISHEIRNPLQSMYAAYYLLSQQVAGPLTEGQQTVVENIRNNIDRISDFSTQFLDLAKIETGVMRFTLETAPLAKVIAPAVQNARVVAQERGITLIVEESDAPPVHVDAGKIEQVATNYLTNALKFTPRGGTVTVRVESCDIGARLSVTDTGLGIPPEDLPKLFTKFFQAKNSGTAGKKGTGLGLALVRAIVEQHGGTVHAASELGSGSTFSADFLAAGASREETVS
jgi:signal transduction histidine kinase